MDLEWAHAMAPGAYIYLVEAASTRWNDMFAAVQVASNLVARGPSFSPPFLGGGEVSMSWAGGEFCQEAPCPSQTYFDYFLQTAGVVYLAAAGDSPSASYPSTSPYVVSVGGTTLKRDISGNYIGESTWQSAGGGPSQIYPTPAYQAGLSRVVGLGGMRGTPDIAAVANPMTPVWVYNSTYCPNQNGDYICSSASQTWLLMGGTSVATPVSAGIVNTAGAFRSSSSLELSYIYNAPGGFEEITVVTVVLARLTPTTPATMLGISAPARLSAFVSFQIESWREQQARLGLPDPGLPRPIHRAGCWGVARCRG